MYEVIQCVIKGDTSALHKLIDFRPCLETEHPPYLRTTKDSRAKALNGERLKRMPGQITPLLFQVMLYILGKFNPYCHDVLPDARHVATSASPAYPEQTLNIQDSSVRVNTTTFALTSNRTLVSHTKGKWSPRAF